MYLLYGYFHYLFRILEIYEISRNKLENNIYLELWELMRINRN